MAVTFGVGHAGLIEGKFFLEKLIRGVLHGVISLMDFIWLFGRRGVQSYWRETGPKG